MVLPLKTHVVLPGSRVEIEACGPEFDKTVWYQGSFDMWGATFVVELYRVEDVHGSAEIVQHLDKREVGDYAEWDRDFEALSETLKPDGGFQTIGLDGEDFAVFIYPLSDS